MFEIPHASGPSTTAFETGWTRCSATSLQNDRTEQGYKYLYTAAYTMLHVLLLNASLCCGKNCNVDLPSEALLHKALHESLLVPVLEWDLLVRFNVTLGTFHRTLILWKTPLRKSKSAKRKNASKQQLKRRSCRTWNIEGQSEHLLHLHSCLRVERTPNLQEHWLNVSAVVHQKCHFCTVCIDSVSPAKVDPSLIRHVRSQRFDRPRWTFLVLSWARGYS